MRTLSKERKPAWLNKKISLKDCHELNAFFKERNIHTVCEEAMCPNIGECFKKKQATFIILGDICTRGCRFCAVKKGIPNPVDRSEPANIAEAVRSLGLKHVVITSVTRDDLPDGGASLFCDTVKALHALDKELAVETLIPDFNLNYDALRLLAKAAPDIIAHNVETVPRLYKDVRRGASYERSIEVLRLLKEMGPGIPLKSGLMLGLGENEGEIYDVFDDLIKAGSSLLSIGQYLAPSKSHVPVAEYIEPKIFEKYKDEALRRGFTYVKSGPYVRSSFEAADYRLNKVRI